MKAGNKQFQYKHGIFWHEKHHESVRAPDAVDAVGRSWCRPHGRAATWLGIGVCGRRDAQGSRGSMMVAFGRGKICYVNEL